MNNAKLHIYANTVLEFVQYVDGVVDLRRPLGERERGLLSELGIGSQFAILTAYNPSGENEPSQNHDRQEDLRRTLQRDVEHTVPVDGCSPDRTHREPSIAVPIPEHRAREIALEYRQDAFFWYDGECFYLVGAGEQFGRVLLPLNEP